MQANNAPSRMRSALRRSLLPVAMALMMATGAWAQTISSTSYAFSTSTGNTLEDMSSGTTTVVGPSIDRAQSAVLPIGFDFNYRGTKYSNFSVSSKGILRLGNIPVSETATSLSGSASAQIGALVQDTRVGGAGKVHYKLVGTSPNRRLVVEWRNMSNVASNGPDYSSTQNTYQVQLSENGQIDLLYGNVAVVGGALSYTAGITDNGSLFAGINTATNTAVYTGGSFPTAQTTAIASGTRYTFTPNSAPAPTGLGFSAVTGTGMTLSWTAPGGPPAYYAYRIYRSLDGTNYEYYSQTVTTSLAVTNLGNASTYHWRVYGMTEGSLSAPLAGSQATSSGTVASGTSTVGPTGTFATLTAAFSNIQTNGLQGPLTLELQSTYSSASETFPLVPPTVAGPGSPITIRPAAGATALTISGTPTAGRGLVEFGSASGGSKHITIDGRPGGIGTTSQLTLSNLSTSATANTSTVLFTANAPSTNNTLNYLTIRGAATGTGTANVLFLAPTGGIEGHNRTTISNNSITDGATTPVNGILSTGANGTYEANTRNVTVSGNSISNMFNAGAQTLMLNAGVGNSDWTVSGNSFFQTLTRTYTTGAIHYAIRFASTGSTVNQGTNFTISNNFVGGTAASAGGSTMTLGGTIATRFVGIGADNVMGAFSITGNTIDNLQLTTSSGATTTLGIFSGIYMNTGYGAISNNTIGRTTGTGIVVQTSTTGAMLGGMTLQTSNGAVINNNTVAGILGRGDAGNTGVFIHAIGVQHSTVGAFYHNFFEITNNTIGGTAAGAGITANANVTGGGSGNCRVAGIQMPFDTASGTPSNRQRSALTITGNTITNLDNNGQGIGGTANSGRALGICVYAGQATITNNTVRQVRSRANQTGTGNTLAAAGIAYQGSIGNGSTADDQFSNVVISGNTVSDIASTPITATTVSVSAGLIWGTPTGATFAGTGHRIESNRIAAVKNTSTGAGALAVGLSLGQGSVRVANNQIQVGLDETGAAITAGNISFIGIHDGPVTAAGQSILYNSVYVAGSGVGTGTANTAAYVRGATPSYNSTSIRNNIFNNVRSNGAGTGRHANVVVNNTTTGWGTVNTNLYPTGNTGFAVGGVGAITGTPTFSTTLAAWQLATSFDAATLVGDPAFTSPATPISTFSLKLDCASAARGVAATGTGVTTDFEGDARSSTFPDIGADELPDAILPTVVTQNPTLSVNGAGTLVVTPAQVNNGSSDNCGPVTLVSVAPNTFSCSDVGSAIPVTLTVRDAKGNTNTGAATVNVVDTVAPTALTQNISVDVGAGCSASITAAMVNNGSTDNCGGTGGVTLVSVVPSSFNCSQVGTNQLVTLNIIDASGNPASATAQVTVTRSFVGAATAITRANSTPTNASSIDFTVTFNEAVTGGVIADFTTGGTSTGSSVTNVTGTGASRTVTVATGTDGTLTLSLNGPNSFLDQGNQAVGAFGPGESYTIDKSAPLTGTLSGLSTYTNVASATINFSGYTDAPAGTSTIQFYVSTDGGTTWTPTGSPVSTSGAGSFGFTYTADGTYAFAARATDSLGNVGSAPSGAGAIQASTIYDATAPSNSGVLAATPAATNTSPLSVNYSGGADATSGFATSQLYYSTNGGTSWTAFGSPSSGASGSFSFSFPSGEGTYAFATLGTDNAGNATAAPTGAGAVQQTTTYDTTAPPTGTLSGLAAATNNSSATINFSGYTDALSGTSTIQLYVSTNGGTTWTPAGSPVSTSGAGSFGFTYTADGAYDFAARATDAAGNVASAPSGAGAIQASTIYDTTAPSVSSFVLNGLTKVTGNIGGTYASSDSGSGLASTTMYVRAPGQPWTSAGTISGGTFSYAPANGNGFYYFDAIATDNAGNASAAAPSGTSGTGSGFTIYNTTVNGAFTYNVTAPGTYLFPMKDPDRNVQVTFGSVTSAGTVTVSAADNNTNTVSLNPARLISKQWVITTGGGFAFTGGATVELGYEDALLNGLNEATDLTHVFAADTPSTYTTYTGGAVSVNTTSNLVTITGVTGFSTWYVGASNASVDDWTLR